jgi:hypothetical protein
MGWSKNRGVERNKLTGKMGEKENHELTRIREGVNEEFLTADERRWTQIKKKGDCTHGLTRADTGKTWEDANCANTRELQTMDEHR